MKPWKKNCILGLALLAFGAARMPFEAGLSKELRAAGLTPAPMEIGTREKIGQTSSAVALGGLRTLVATFLNLRAFGFFEVQRWDDLADTFENIVDLAPKTGYYWQTGSWHAAFNSASYYLNDKELPPLRRKEAWRTSILRGREFLERGIRNNPDDHNMLSDLGFLLSNSNKFQAFRDRNEAFFAASEAYRRAADTGNALGYVRRSQFFSLARVKGKELEALALGRSLYKEKINHVPTLLTLLFVLEAFENPQMDTSKRAIELFGTPEKAYEALSAHWHRTKEGFPVYGVASALESLEKTLNISAKESIFNQPLQPQSGPDDWFSK